MSSGVRNGACIKNKFNEKYEYVKNFTQEYYFIAKQYITEAFGASQAITRDDLLEKMIMNLTESHNKHKLLCFAICDTMKSFERLASSQEGVCGVLCDLNNSERYVDDSLRSEISECAKLFQQNSEATKLLCQIFDTVIDKLKTLCDSAIQDTINNAQEVKYARLKLDSLISQHQAKYVNSTMGSQTRCEFENRINAAKKNYEDKKSLYFAKQKYLEFNRTSTLITTLSLLRKSIKLYYCGSPREMIDCLAEFRRCPFPNKKTNY